MSKVKYNRWECGSCFDKLTLKVDKRATVPHAPLCGRCKREMYLISVESQPKPKTPRFTPSKLKALYEENESGAALFFTRETMSFFGDTMKNYGVRRAQVVFRCGPSTEAWELYRIRPVKFGLQDSSYFALDGQHLVGVVLILPETNP